MIVIVYFLLILGVLIFAEIGAYLHHRYIAHDDIIPGVHSIHQIHHRADLKHQAHEDFYVVITFLLITGIILYLMNLGNILWFGYFLVIVIFIYNYFIHRAYHVPDHWLNKYNWFKRDKKIHFQHHVNPKVNYGIASHFSDIIFGTYQYPSSLPIN